MAMRVKTPPGAYLRQNVKPVQLNMRMSPETKALADAAAEQLGTSVKMFVEAAIRWYRDALKKEGKLK